MSITTGDSYFDAQLSTMLQFRTPFAHEEIANLSGSAPVSSDVDSLTSRIEPHHPLTLKSSSPDTRPSRSFLKHRHSKSSSSCIGGTSTQEGSGGLLQRVRRTSTSIMSKIAGRTCRDGSSISNHSKMSGPIPSAMEKEVDSPRSSSSSSVATDLACRFKGALNITSHKRDGALEPPQVSSNPLYGAAARAAAANANRKATSPERGLIRNDSNVTLSQFGDESRESGINMAGENSLSVDTRDRRGSHVHRKDPLSCLPMELASLIFTHLSASSLAQAALVSRKWTIVAADQHVWRRAFLDKFEPKARSHPLPLTVGGRGVGKTRCWEQDWNKMFKARSQLDANWLKGNAMAIYLNGHTDSVYCVQYNEKIIITGSRDRTFRIWDIHTFECIKVIGIPSAIDTDRREIGNHLPHPPLLPEDHVVHPNPARALDPTIYHVPKYYHDASILCLQFDDEIMVTGSSDCTLIIWDIKTWQPIHRLRSHTAGVLDIAFDKEKIVSCSKDATLCVWDRVSGELLQRITGHLGPVNAVQLRGNLVISASGEGCARLWNLNFQRRRRRSSVGGGEGIATVDAKCVKEFWSKDRGLACVEFSDDARYVLAGGNDQVIYKFDTQTGKRMEFAKGHENLVRSLYLDEANGRVVSGSYDSSLRVWDYEKGCMTMCFPHWTSSWMLSAKSDYRRIVCTSQDGRALILDFGWGVEGVELLKG